MIAILAQVIGLVGWYKPVKSVFLFFFFFHSQLQAPSQTEFRLQVWSGKQLVGQGGNPPVMSIPQRQGITELTFINAIFLFFF